MAEKRLKVQRSRKEGFRLPLPVLILATAAAVAAAFAVAAAWQRFEGLAVPVQETGATIGYSEEEETEETAKPVVVEAATLPLLPEGSEQPAFPAARSYTVEYQVPESAPVDDSYFDDALFVGDSITAGISLYGVMPNATVIASTGINPNVILTKPSIRDEEGELHTVLETMADYQPGKIYLMLGANGVGWITLNQFIERYEELILAVQAQHPDAQIYVQSILPVTQEKSLSENGLTSNEKIDEYNQALMEMSRKLGLPYVNISEAMRGPDGALPADTSADGMHIGPESYRSWMNYLKSHTLEDGRQDSPPQTNS